MKFAILLINLLYAPSSWSASALYIEQIHKSNLFGATQVKLYSNGKRVLTDFRGPNANRSVLFDLSSRYLWIIDHAKNTIAAVRPEDVKKLQAVVQRHATQAQAQLKAFPKEWQDRARGFLKGLDQTKQTFRFKLVKDGSSWKKWPCKQYKGLPKQGLNISLNACVTSWGETGISTKEQEQLKTMYSYLSSWTQGLSKMGAPRSFDLKQFNGFPVHLVSKEQGKTNYEVQTIGIGRADIDAERFNLPKGYGRLPVSF